MPDKNLPKTSSRKEIDAFLRQASATPVAQTGAARGRLIFAMDATASREPTWDRACHLQCEMFTETAHLGGLEVQLCYYRGYKEFRATPWSRQSKDLLRHMTEVSCLGGRTQIEKVLSHALAETQRKPVAALVFVGDCMEENVDRLCDLAGQMGLLGVPAFMFHEGSDPTAQRAFKQIARLTHGAYCQFNSASAQQLRDLLRAAAVFASGGRRALEDFTRDKSRTIQQLTHQLGR